MGILYTKSISVAARNIPVINYGSDTSDAGGSLF